MGSGKMGIWSNGKILLDIEFNDIKKERPPSYNQYSNIPIFHHSIISLSHVRGKNSGLNKFL